MKRVVTPELLDSDAGTPDEITVALADLRRINRWFGGIGTTRKMIERVARQTGRREFSLLDVAAGSGYVPEAVARVLARKGIRLDITLADRSPAHIGACANGISADAAALPFRDRSFDLVSCSLFAHHLAPDELVRFAAEGLRVCRTAMLINDLRRNALFLALVYAGFPLFRSRFTRHDAPASVRAAYTEAEIAEILSAAPAARIEVHRSYLFRMGIILLRGARQDV